MVRHKMFSICASALLVGVFASCGGLDDPADGLDDASAVTADDIDPALFAGDSTIALTTEGLIRGTETASTRQFLGIPYAAPPVDDLRWRPPERHARWRGVLDTTQFGAHCPQQA